MGALIIGLRTVFGQQLTQPDNFGFRRVDGELLAVRRFGFLLSPPIDFTTNAPVFSSQFVDFSDLVCAPNHANLRALLCSCCELES